MSDLRWLLLVAGLVVFLFIFWLTRRESAGKPIHPVAFLRRKLAALKLMGEAPISSPEQPEPTAAEPPLGQPARIITVRLIGQGNATFSGEALFLAMRESGLRHGQFGIFHRHDPDNPSRVLFSVASLVEPGSFDLTRIKTDRFPGVSFFMALPGSVDEVTAFDDMLATARLLATELDGQLLDEGGSRLSVQRERFLREEVIQFQHKRLSR